MSRHHRAQTWTSFAPGRRAELERLLPLPCIQCGRPILPTDLRSSWQVGHRQDAALGGRPTRANTGPIHTRCNRKAGGRLGAAISNARRRARAAEADGLRPWH
jgi:5-methylcytosine-specific restriction endonuclease McrA